MSMFYETCFNLIWVSHQYFLNFFLILSSGRATIILPSTSTTALLGSVKRKVATFFGMTFSHPSTSSTLMVFFVSSTTCPLIPMKPLCELLTTSTPSPTSSCRNMFCGVIIVPPIKILWMATYKRHGKFPCIYLRLFLPLSSLSLISMVSEEKPMLARTSLTLLLWSP